MEDLTTVVDRLVRDAGGDSATARRSLTEELTTRRGEPPLPLEVATLLQVVTVGGDVVEIPG